MLTYRLSGKDLEDIRFAVSPMGEVVTSLRAVRDPGRFPLNLPWLQMVRPMLADLDWNVLRWVVNDTMGCPDYLTPLPSSPMTRFEDELAIIADVDCATYSRQMRDVHGVVPSGLEWPDGPQLLARALDQYWTAAVRAYWPRIRAILNADITYRAQVMAAQGTAAMLNDLAPVIRYADGVLQIDRVAAADRHEEADGRGLTLQPRLFGPDAVIPFDHGAPPQVGYPPRGQGHVWQVVHHASPDDLARLIGRPRARILQMLDCGRTTTDLAAQLGVTPPSVSQQLQLLKRTGLIEAHRSGKNVVYRRTDRGNSLLGS